MMLWVYSTNSVKGSRSSFRSRFDSLSAEEGSDEALEALSHQEQIQNNKLARNLASRTHVPAHKTQPDLEKRKTIGKILMKKKNYNSLE